MEKIAKFLSSSKRIEIDVNEDNVKSIAFDGRAWSFVIQNGGRMAYTDEQKFRYQLSQELKSSQKANKFIEQLKTKGGK